MKNFERWKNKKPEHSLVDEETINNLVKELNSFEHLVYNTLSREFNKDYEFKSLFAAKSRMIIARLISSALSINGIELKGGYEELTNSKKLIAIRNKKKYNKETIDCLFDMNRFTNILAHPDEPKFAKLSKRDFAEFLKWAHYVTTNIFEFEDEFDMDIYNRDGDIESSIQLVIGNDINNTLSISENDKVSFDADSFLELGLESVMTPKRNKDKAEKFEEAKSKLDEYNYDPEILAQDFGDLDLDFEEEILVPLPDSEEYQQSKPVDEVEKIEEVEEEQPQSNSLSLDGIDLELPSEKDNIANFKKQWKK